MSIAHPRPWTNVRDIQQQVQPSPRRVPMDAVVGTLGPRRPEPTRVSTLPEVLARTGPAQLDVGEPIDTHAVANDTYSRRSQSQREVAAGIQSRCAAR